MIPSSRALLSRHKRFLPLDTWIQSGLQENVFGPESDRMKTRYTSEDRQNQGTTPMTTFETRPSTMSSAILVELRRITWSDSKDSKYRNCNSTNSLIHHRSWRGNSIQNSSQYLFWFFIECHVVGQRSGDVYSLDELKASQSVHAKDFPNFEMLEAKIAFALNKIIQDSQFKKKVGLKEQKPQKENRFLRRRQIAFMIYDNFQVTGAHDTVVDYAGLFSVILHDDNIQDFDTRWDEVLLSMSKNPSDDILENLYKLRIRESDQFKTVLELFDMEIHQKISFPHCQKLKTMVKSRKDQKLRLRNFDAGHRKIESRAVIKSRKGIIGVEGGKGICYHWKEKGQWMIEYLLR